ncbi:hypothetical protein JET76_22980 [Pseudomonas putida]|uniref:beta strand repeat-containing protein n=1 Tax=Pseudomonas putida TaxID=303 RepID=UPI0018E69847|nr:hypothetical protein [Pseudomonas putida]MBI6944193.1 hypothetical protein [Pseudomonas putida]MBI6960359.1 hypothetical protein [Pseudomonas putida]
MFRVDNDSAVAIMPAATSAGTPGYFTDGNPATGQPATVLAAEFMNMVMMELANLVTDSGQTLTKNDYKQVSKAVQAMIANLSTVTWDKVTNKPTDWAVAGKTTLTGAVTLASTLTVAGVSTLNSTLTVAGATTLKTTLGVTGATTLSSTLSVAGAATFAANVTVNGTCVMANGNVGTSIEIGSVSKAGTPYLDFHSSGQNIDYDSRILASGGDGTVGGGTLTLMGGNISLAADTSVTGVLNVSSVLATAGSVRAANYVDLGYQTTTAGSRAISFYSNSDSTRTASIAVGGTTAALATMALTAGTVAIVGAATFSSAVSITGAATLSSSLAVTGAATLASTLDVAGVMTVANSLRPAQWIDIGYQNTTAGNRQIAFYSASDTTNTAKIVVSGTTLAGSLMGITAGTIALTGAVTASSTLAVTGAATLSSTLNVTGAVTLASTLKAAGELQSTTANGLRLVNGDYGVMARNYGGNFYLLSTASGDQYGNFSALRPFMISIASGAVTLGNSATINGGATIAGGATIDTLTVAGASTLSGTLGVTGSATCWADLNVGTTFLVNGASTLKSTLSVTGATTLSSTLAVTGAVTLSSSLTVATTAIITGAATLKSSLSVAGTATVAALSVTGVANLSSTLSVNGGVAINSGVIELGSGTGTNAYIDFHSSGASSDYDVRVIASGGSAASGSGALSINAAGGLWASANIYAGGGSCVIQTDGNISGSVWGGYLSTYISNAVSTTAVGAATAALAAGAVGTYGFMWVAATLGPGDLVAASALYWGSYNYKSSAQPAGTWMCCGYVVPGDKATVFKRVA